MPCKRQANFVSSRVEAMPSRQVSNPAPLVELKAPGHVLRLVYSYVSSNNHTPPGQFRNKRLRAESLSSAPVPIIGVILAISSDLTVHEIDILYVEGQVGPHPHLPHATCYYAPSTL